MRLNYCDEPFISKKRLDIHKPKSLNCKWRCWWSFPGIPPHVDTHSAFEDTILSLSLGAQVNTFQLIPNNETQTCLLSLHFWRRVCSHVSVFISDCDGFPPSWWLPGSSGVACSQSSGDEGREQIPVDSWVSLNLSCWPSEPAPERFSVCSQDYSSEVWCGPILWATWQPEPEQLDSKQKGYPHVFHIPQDQTRAVPLWWVLPPLN